MLLNLRIPGPTPCPDDVMEAMSHPMINHRSGDFKDVMLRVTQGVKDVMKTEGDPLILSASGTGGLEAAIVNVLSPGDKVLSVGIGYFGDRFASIAETYGANVTRLKFPWGEAADSDSICNALRNDSSIKAVIVTHNETSTGVTNDLLGISQIVKDEFGKLLIVDGVSSVSSLPLPVDKWRCDVVVTASQKGWMVPPGLAFISMSKEAWKANEVASMPRFYFDLSKANNSLSKGETPWTPALSAIFAMDVALKRINDEGIENVFSRHAALGNFTRKNIESLGLSILPNKEVASNTVTAVAVPEDFDIARFRKILRDEHDVVVAGGQGALRDKIFRIGHLGYVVESDIRIALKAISTTLDSFGFRSKTGTI